MYEQAGAFAPAHGTQRAIIFREWGMMLRDSGERDATDQAIEKFEVAVAEAPNDTVARYALATVLDRKGHYRRIIEFLEPVLQSKDMGARRRVYPLLLKAYERCGEILEAARLRQMEG